MTVTALVSGGKDSVYSAYLSDAQARPVDEIVTLRPSDPHSMMFHTPNLAAVALQAEAWGKRHRFIPVPGPGEAEEEAAIERALGGDRGWVVAGAIASAYQASRLHRVCHRVGRPLFTPLWGKAPGRVLREEVGAGLDIRLVHLSAEGLTPELLGRRLDPALVKELERRSETGRAFHTAGEGGEYETVVVGAPFWRSRLTWTDTRIHGDRGTVSMELLSPSLATEGPRGATESPLGRHG